MSHGAEEQVYTNNSLCLGSVYCGSGLAVVVVVVAVVVLVGCGERRSSLRDEWDALPPPP